MTLKDASNFIRPLYLYAMSLIALITIISGSVSICNVIIRNVVFGVSGNWYDSPITSCEYELNNEKYSPDGSVEAAPEEVRRKRYEQCIERKNIDAEMRAKHDLANDVSWGISMILVGIPLFYFHWNLIRRERRDNS